MRSDDRVAAALAALSPRIDAYRFEMLSAIDRGRQLLTTKNGAVVASALGEFAEGRIDPARYASISAEDGPLDVIGCGLVERGISALEELSKEGNEAFVIEAPYQTSAAQLIRERLDHLGKVFSISGLIELVRRRLYDPAQHGASYDGYPFARWNVVQRRLAPPLVIQLDGRDVDSFELAPFLDGAVTFVLVVDGECAPAPLSRLISPGAFVGQVDDTSVLSRVADFNGPAVVALMKGSEARFVHDPRTGSSVWQRIQLLSMPEAQPRRTFGARTLWQQRDDLAHLKSLAEQPVIPPDTADTLIASIVGAGPDPTDRLATWLLDRSASTPPNS